MGSSGWAASKRQHEIMVSGPLVQHLWGWDPLQAVPHVRPSPGTQTQSQAALSPTPARQRE